MNRRFRGVSAAITMAVLTVPMFAVPTTAAAPLTLALNIGSTCVEGTKPSGGPITVKVLRSDGSTKATRTDSDTGGEWGVCFATPLVIGYKIKMTTDPGSGNLTRTVSIPNLTIVANRTTSKVKGRAPAGKSIFVRYVECYPSGCNGSLVRTGMANTSGRWSKDLSSSVDVDGSDELEVLYQNSHGDSFYARTIAPYMEVRHPNQVFVGCLPQGTTTVKLRKSDGTVRATRALTATRDCSGEVGSFRRNGAPVNINVGNRVTADFASDASLTWPAMSVDGSGSILSGHCIANSRFVVFVQRASSSSPFEGTTNASGDFSHAVGWTFKSGDRLDLICETTRGDRVRRARTLP